MRITVATSSFELLLSNTSKSTRLRRSARVRNTSQPKSTMRFVQEEDGFFENRKRKGCEALLSTKEITTKLTRKWHSRNANKPSDSSGRKIGPYGKKIGHLVMRMKRNHVLIRVLPNLLLLEDDQHRRSVELLLCLLLNVMPPFE